MWALAESSCLFIISKLTFGITVSQAQGGVLNPFYMSNTERDYESLVFRIEQLEQNQQVMAKYMAQMKRQLDDLSVQVNSQPELQQRTNLQDALSQLHQQFNEHQALPEAPVEVVNLPTQEVSCSDSSQLQPPPVQSFSYQLVFDRSGSRAVLLEALLKAQKRLIIVCPWLSRNSIDADLMQKFRDCLNRNCRIEIGWGYLSGRGKTGKGWGNNAIRDLRQLEQDYPEQFKLKLLGTHEKFLVCDDSIAMLGSHNVLSSNAQGFTREVGIRTTDSNIIQGLIDRFDGAEVQDAQVIDENLAAGSVSLDDSEPNEDEIPNDSNDENAQGAYVNAKDFLRRYDNKERDFIGINLAREDLTSAKLDGANLIEANLAGTNLTKADLRWAKLLQANLSKATLCEANLGEANLTGASLSGANLIKANLVTANLTAADLSKARLISANLSHINLSGAKLAGVNLVGTNLKYVKLSGADLSGANLCGANLSLNENLSGVNLTKADLRGANLEKANLEKANLTGANLGGANLNGAKLSGAIMPDGTVHE